MFCNNRQGIKFTQLTAHNPDTASVIPAEAKRSAGISSFLARA